MNEFDLITTYFTQRGSVRGDVRKGIGDDAAVVRVPEGQELVISTDTLVAGVHFPLETQADDIGYKALAVNLSDLAAMGATPAWALLALTLPENNEAWLKKFSQGFFHLAQNYHVQLIGGDLTRGPSSITVQILGLAPQGSCLYRSGAKAGDRIYVTGTLGDAGLGLREATLPENALTKDQKYFRTRLQRPEPRIAIGQALRGLASAAIDVSDGLAADLNHLLTQSQVGARINVDRLPFSPALERAVSREEAIALALNAGDDYELCFTIPAENTDALAQRLTTIACPYTYIGDITDTLAFTQHYQHGGNYHGTLMGYQHF